MMHIYAFGSICRGELLKNSDIDLLVLQDKFNPELDLHKFSIYSYQRITELWQEGNPFAWHLYLESKLIHSSNQLDFLRHIGPPEKYKKCKSDCAKFYEIFKEAHYSVTKKANIFDLSTIFLSMRNLATCYSLGMMETPDFSRKSALNIKPHNIPLDSTAYQIFERARILSTRGIGEILNKQEIDFAVEQLQIIDDWLKKRKDEAKNNE